MQCWGSGSDSSNGFGLGIGGQLGNGNDSNTLTPVQVLGLTNVSEISAGASRTCARSGSTVQCWGDQSYNMLGFTYQRTAPDKTKPILLASGGVLPTNGVMQSQGTVLVRQTANGGTMMGHVTPVSYSTYYSSNGAKVPAFLVDYNPLAAAAALFIQQYSAHVAACNNTTTADASTITLSLQYAGTKLAACLDATDKANYLSGMATLLAGAKTYLFGGPNDCVAGLGSCTATSITNSTSSPAHFPFTVSVPSYTGTDSATAPYANGAYFNTLNSALSAYRSSILGGTGTGLERTLQLVGVATFDNNSALVTSRVSRPSTVSKCIATEDFAAQGPLAKCGDGVCVPSENASSCPVDCATP